MGRHKQDIKRCCIVCNSSQTYTDRLGYLHWYKLQNNNWICDKCHNINRNKNRIRFGHKQILLKHNPRIGVCNWCRAVYPFDTTLTHFHHEFYDKTNPLKDSIEICVQCHIKTMNGFGKSKK